jgi:hypothetical protein
MNTRFNSKKRQNIFCAHHSKKKHRGQSGEILQKMSRYDPQHSAARIAHFTESQVFAWLTGVSGEWRFFEGND